MKPTPLGPLLLLSLASSLHAAAQEDKPTGSEVVVTYSDQIYTIPLFNPTTAPRFGDNNPNNNPVPFTSSSLAPPATASVTFTPITTPIPTPPSTTITSSLAPPATSFSSFSAITSSISSFAGNASATTSASSGGRSSGSSSSAAPAASSSAPTRNGGVRGGGKGVGVGVVVGGLVVALGVL